MCQTFAPRSRHASVIAAANRPEETLVMRRTSSIGAIVPPPVTTTFIKTASRKRSRASGDLRSSRDGIRTAPPAGRIGTEDESPDCTFVRELAHFRHAIEGRPVAL